MIRSSRETRMKMIVEEFQKYVATYTDQIWYETYSDETFLNDMLYGLGLAMGDEQFKYAGGYSSWKKVLEDFLKTNKITIKEGE